MSAFDTVSACYRRIYVSTQLRELTCGYTRDHGVWRSKYLQCVMVDVTSGHWLRVNPSQVLFQEQSCIKTDLQPHPDPVCKESSSLP